MAEMVFFEFGIGLPGLTEPRPLGILGLEWHEGMTAREVQEVLWEEMYHTDAPIELMVYMYPLSSVQLDLAREAMKSEVAQWN